MVYNKADYDVSILGAGLSAVYGAYKLKSNTTCLVYSENNLGGILKGEKWNSFYVDNGCHLFDGNEEHFEFYETVGGMKTHSVKYGSVNTGKFTDQIATPEINDDKLSTAAYDELIDLKFSEKENISLQNLKEVFYHRYGEIGGSYLSKVQRKFTGMNSELINSSEFKKFSVFHRLRIGDDKMSNTLKKNNAYLDEIICSSLGSRGLDKYQKSMYPKNRGTTGFVHNSEKFLKDNNFALISNYRVEKIIKKNNHYEIIDNQGSKFTTKYILSTLPQTLLQKLLGHQTNPPPNFISYKIVLIEIEAENVSDIYYVQDFDIDDVTYRGSNMGYYSNQYSDNGTTFVTAEIPYAMEEIEIDIESIKLELIKQNILVKDCKIIDYKIIDKKNIIPINNEIQELELPENIYSLLPTSFSMKSKLEDIDKICLSLTNEI